MVLPQSHDSGLAVLTDCPTRLHDFVTVGSLAMRYFRQIFWIGVSVSAGSVFLYVKRTVIVNDPLGATEGIEAGTLRVNVLELG